jgi:hypothetical protein
MVPNLSEARNQASSLEIPKVMPTACPTSPEIRPAIQLAELLNTPTRMAFFAAKFVCHRA